jgi:glucose-6-phosphate dehydrogenase assembly protein OpcA
MSTTTPDTSSTAVPLGQVEQELSRQLGESRDKAEAPLLLARLSNLVIFCDQSAQAEVVAQAVPEIVAIHPARVLLLIGEPGAELPLTASVRIWSHTRSGQQLYAEQVTLRAGGQNIEQLPFAVWELLIGDLPTNLWWASTVPPPLAGHFLYDLTEYTQQIIYDSIGWLEPARGVMATCAWLEKLEHTATEGPWRVAADLNWRRLKFWRRTLAQALDPNTAPGVVESITEVLVEHGPHAVIQAWELVSWLASRLGWQVQAGKVEPNVEIAWQIVAAHGPLRVRIRRLAEGLSELRRVRVACTLDGTPGAINITADEGHHLAAVLEGRGGAARTVTVPQLTLPELIVRQLSDRERDPIFGVSMAVARVLAQSVVEHG